MKGGVENNHNGQFKFFSPVFIANINKISIFAPPKFTGD
jgi:hypothetical protein